MKISKPTVDKIVTVTAGVAAALLPILTRHHVITTGDAQDIGAAVLVAVGGYHGGATVQAKLSAPAVSDRTP